MIQLDFFILQMGWKPPTSLVFFFSVFLVCFEGYLETKILDPEESGPLKSWTPTKNPHTTAKYRFLHLSFWEGPMILTGGGPPLIMELHITPRVISPVTKRKEAFFFGTRKNSTGKNAAASRLRRLRRIRHSIPSSLRWHQRCFFPPRRRTKWPVSLPEFNL